MIVATSFLLLAGLLREFSDYEGDSEGSICEVKVRRVRELTVDGDE